MTSLWRHRGFLHLWGAQATSTFGNRIGREAITLAAVILLGASPLDMAWLALESRDTPMHVGSLSEFTLPDDAPPDFLKQQLDRMRAPARIPLTPSMSE